jgi:transketolase
MRKAFAETLYRLARQDDRIVLLTGDLGFQLFDDFQGAFNGRFINTGVAEAQLMAAAAGLAKEGFRPVAYSIAAFATARPFEQIRYCIGYHALPVMIVGAGRGLLYGTSGVSHHAMDDIALMSAVPGMTVVIPGDGVEIRHLMPQLLALDAPSYMSVGRYGEPELTAEEPPVLGKARRLQRGERITLFSTGELTYELCRALARLREAGIRPAAYHLHTVKPLDTVTLEKAAKTSSRFIVLEEHLPQGGLWSGIAEWKARMNTPVKLHRLGPPDSFFLGNMRREEYRRKYKFDAEAVFNTCRRLWDE